jgi:spore coat polysaccharide biosynthesis protein SpsF
MGSTRLPGKVLADLCGRPLLQRVIDRVKATNSVTEVIVATTSDKTDDIIQKWCDERSILTYRGSVHDVLDRFWNCAKAYQADIIIRVTADDPLKDPGIIQRAIDLCTLRDDVDYVSNTLRPTFPEGLDIEVFRRRALERAATEARLPSEREHVTPYIWKNPKKFNIINFTNHIDLSHIRLTVDKPSDLELVREVYRNFSAEPLVRYERIIAWLMKNPSLLRMNSGTPRNEGYTLSITKES